MCPTGISPRMQARSLKHRYSPIGELRLDLTHDLVVNRKCSRRLDGFGRLNQASILIPSGHLLLWAVWAHSCGRSPYTEMMSQRGGFTAWDAKIRARRETRELTRLYELGGNE